MSSDQSADNGAPVRYQIPPLTYKDRVHLTIADTHIPYHDPYAVEELIKFATALQPEMVHLLGDIIDFYEVSRFSKDPARKYRLVDEISQTREFLQRLRDACPRSVMIFSEGNHEERLPKFLATKAPELAQILGMTVAEQLKLKELKIKWNGADNPYMVHGLLFLHGTWIRKHAGFSAKAHYEEFERDLIIGHAHRFGMYSKTVMGQSRHAYETGCLCDFRAPYVKYPNWQQGWTVSYHNAARCHEVVQVKIAGNGLYLWEGELRGKLRPSPMGDREPVDYGVNGHLLQS